MKNSIVLYFTCSLNTRKVAMWISLATTSDVQEIKPVIPYTSEYTPLTKQAKQEIETNYHPDIMPIPVNIDDYDVIYIGSPNWWSTIAPPVATFLSNNDLSNKIIVPFITHGGGGKGHADKDIQTLCPNAQVLDCLAIYENGGSNMQANVAQWLQGLQEELQ